MAHSSYFYLGSLERHSKNAEWKDQEHKGNQSIFKNNNKKIEVCIGSSKDLTISFISLKFCLFLTNAALFPGGPAMSCVTLVIFTVLRVSTIPKLSPCPLLLPSCQSLTPFWHQLSASLPFLASIFQPSNLFGINFFFQPLLSHPSSHPDSIFTFFWPLVFSQLLLSATKAKGQSLVLFPSSAIH